MNFKVFFGALALCALTFLASVAACFVGYKLFAPRVYSADLVAIKKGFYKTAESEKKLKNMLAGANAQIETMRRELSEKQSAIKKLAEEAKAAPTEEARRRINESKILPAMREFNSQREFMRRFSSEARARIAKASREENAKLTSEIKAEVRKIAASIRAAYIIDSSSNMYAAPARDISAEIIRRLNAGKAGDAAGAEDSGGNAAKPAVGSADSGGAKTPAQASDLLPDSVHNEAGAPDVAELPSAL